MYKFLSAFFGFVISLILSGSILYSITSYTEQPKEKQKTEKVQKAKNLNQKNADLDKERQKNKLADAKFNQCLDEIKNSNTYDPAKRCECLRLYGPSVAESCIKDLAKPKNPETSQFNTFYKSFTSSTFYQVLFGYTLVTLIIIGIILAQTITFAYYLSYLTGNVISSFEKWASWCVEAPPVLGIVGTLFAMIIFFAEKANQPDIWDLFFAKFVIAAATTILGGISNVINHWLWSGSLFREASVT